ncbi:MAG: AzlD domain-containing protein [Corynebacterium sp.]|nr:AzlD domain-containing protein [Corynebacterium sp.]
MPDGVTSEMIWAVVLPIGIITVVLRALPFGFLRYLKGNPFLSLLGLMMPVGVMTVLVVYTVLGQLSAPGGVLPVAIGVIATVVLHLWKRDSGLSIVGGTVVYLVLVNLF